MTAARLEAPEQLTPLETLAAEAYALVQRNGLTPVEAAESVVDLEHLDEASILYAVQRAVGQMTATMMSRARKPAKNGDRSERIERAVQAMGKTLGHALALLSIEKQGIDGRERPLLSFTIEDHDYRRQLEESVEEGARGRKQWHAEVIASLQKHRVATIADLPLPEQYALARSLEDA